MTKGKALLIARQKFGPSGHVRIRKGGNLLSVTMCSVGTFDGRGFIARGVGRSWEEAFLKAGKRIT